MGFADRLNETFRGAGVALQVATLRQKLLDAQRVYEDSLRQLGERVMEVYRADGDEVLDARFRDQVDAVKAATGVVASCSMAIAELEGASAPAADAPVRRFCASCGLDASENTGTFCTGCGSQLE